MNGELSGGIRDPNFRGASEKRREVEAEQKSIEKKTRAIRICSSTCLGCTKGTKYNNWAANRRQSLTTSSAGAPKTRSPYALSYALPRLHDPKKVRESPRGNN